MAASEIGFVIFYVAFFTFIALIGASGGAVDATTAASPLLDSTGVGAIDAIVYFLTLQGLTLFGLAALWAAAIGLVLDVTLVYVIARLVRGGG
jgi:hypothetical protein